jgi:hypothetical protein
MTNYKVGDRVVFTKKLVERNFGPKERLITEILNNRVNVILKDCESGIKIVKVLSGGKEISIHRSFIRLATEFDLKKDKIKYMF